MAGTDQCRAPLQRQAKKVREKSYDSIDVFLKGNGLNHENYLNLIRASLKRPRMLLTRTVQQMFTNTFNPWIAKVLIFSNTDMQFILDE